MGIVVRAGDAIENPVSGQRLIFRKTAGDTGGELLEVESIYAKPSPSRPLPPPPGRTLRGTLRRGARPGRWRGANAERGGGLGHTASYPTRNVGGEGGDQPQLADAPGAEDGGVLRGGVGARAGREDKRQGHSQLAAGCGGRAGVRARVPPRQSPRAVQRVLFGPLAAVGRSLGYRGWYPYPRCGPGRAFEAAGERSSVASRGRVDAVVLVAVALGFLILFLLR
jgi:hypothetical protein